jgi:signal transduction histidine kinase
MNLTGELNQSISDTIRPAAFFILDKNYFMENPVEYGALFGDTGITENFEDIRNFLPLENPDVKNAVDMAFHQTPSQIRFKCSRGEKTFYFDLYCFPELGRDDNSIGCFLADRGRDEETALSLQSKIDRLDIINQAVRAFAETNNLTEILRIILLAVTSGPGLGFNRGFILLTDESQTFLHGCLATGPSSAAEAGEIWRSLSKKPLSLEEVLRLYRSGESNSDTYVNQLVTSLKIPITGDSNFLKKSFEERRAISVEADSKLSDDEKALMKIIAAESIAVAPLISRDKWLGVIIADNLITSKQITTSDMKLLEIFARYASDAIDNTHLYGRLQRKIARLKEANEKIITTRENLVRAEKLSGVSKLALMVAHEIRNPLTVIGGHANARLRKMDNDPDNMRIFEIISRQAARIEDTLDRFSSIVSLSEKKDGEFNFPELVTETLRTLSSVVSETMPLIGIDENIKDEKIMVDQGLFFKAMMAIFRNASSLSGGLSHLQLEIRRQFDSAVILIGRDKLVEKFAESFFNAMRVGQEKSTSQEISVALEILRHYGGDIGVGSPEDPKGWLSVEFPLTREDI